MNHPSISHNSLPLKRFLTISQCPLDWQTYDLYLFRDAEVVFYVGQSDCAFQRVWNHILGGFKARSIVGRFILCNWPLALQFSIELHHSGAPKLEAGQPQRDIAEQRLIQQHAPCFNDVHNPSPTPFPSHYHPPNASVPRPRSLRRMIKQAELALQRDRNLQAW